MSRNKTITTVATITLILSIITPSEAKAWSNHGLDTSVAFREHSLAQSQNIPCEKLESFLEATKQTPIGSLSENFDATEKKIQAYLASYPARPANLKLDESLSNQELKQSFLKSIRVNLKSPLKIFLQDIPGLNLPREKTRLSLSDVSLVQSLSVAQPNFIQLTEGDLVSSISVLSTAVDEPDYGLDIGLWDDSTFSNRPTTESALYHYGKIPFGNPSLEFATQAPFHMGFYYEDFLTQKFAPGTQKSLLESRVMMYRDLSLFAFRTGHAYWGYRFAGWALHYIQDLTQPYHSTAVPGNKIISELKYGLAGLLKKPAYQNQVLTETSNLHLAFEQLQFMVISKQLEGAPLDQEIGSRILKNLSTTLNQDQAYSWSPSFPRNMVASQSFILSAPLRKGLGFIFPESLIFYPNLDEKHTNFIGVAQKYSDSSLHSQSDSQSFLNLLDQLMRNLGNQSRVFINDLIEDVGR